MKKKEDYSHTGIEKFREETFIKWMELLKHAAVKYFGFDERTVFSNDWRAYFNEGFTPSDALKEDMKYVKYPLKSFIDPKSEGASPKPKKFN